MDVSLCMVSGKVSLCGHLCKDECPHRIKNDKEVPQGSSTMTCKLDRSLSSIVSDDSSRIDFALF